MELLPIWVDPCEVMSAGAIQAMCDADRRPSKPMDTLIIRIPDGH
jgi:hypothetical protein